MLVLSREKNEKIHIGPEVIVTVVEVRGFSTRLGVEAPDNMRVLRNELVGPGFTSTTPPSESFSISLPSELYRQLTKEARSKRLSVDEYAAEVLGGGISV